MVPQINNAAHTQAAIRAAKYLPRENRGADLARAHKYGISFSDYLETADQKTCVVMQTET